MPQDTQPAISSYFADSRFDLLIHAYLEGQISEADAVLLKRCLQDPHYVRLFVERCKQEQVVFEIISSDVSKGLATAALEEMDSLQEFAEYEKIAPAVVPEKSLPKLEGELVRDIRYPKTSHRVNRGIIASLGTVAAAMILIILFAKFAPPKSGFEVATLTDSLGAKWGEDKTAVRPGTRFSAGGGNHRLQEGLVKLLFDNDTKVILEAPAEFQILTRDQIQLTYGQLYATVPRGAIGFTVNTPAARIIDLGTEFGIKADFRGDTSLHVIKGKTVLIAGDKSNKVSLEVDRGNAKKVSAVNQTASDILCDETLFAREIDSAGQWVWRGQTQIDLTDVVGGGNGFERGIPNAGIDVSTGRMIPDLPDDGVKVGLAGFRAVHSSPFIDGVFVPGLADGMTPVTADGAVSVRFPKTSGNYWGYIFNGAFHKGDKVPRHTLQLDGMAFGTPENPSISIHSNQGITFDLSAIRKCIPDMTIVKFRSLIGISETVSTYGDRSAVDFWVFLDGRKVFEKQLSNADRAVPVEIPVTDTDRFLTLAVTEAGDGWAFDWALFGRPALMIEPAD